MKIVYPEACYNAVYRLKRRKAFLNIGLAGKAETPSILSRLFVFNFQCAP